MEAAIGRHLLVAYEVVRTVIGEVDNDGVVGRAQRLHLGGHAHKEIELLTTIIRAGPNENKFEIVSGAP